METTIAAISTAMSASGIGIVRISGENAMDVISRIYRSKGGKKKIKEVPSHTIHYGYIYNGEELVESYGREVIKDPGLASDPITLGEDEYFVMGDNRNYSKDSRFPDVGNIKRADIIGKAWLRIYPFDKIGFIRHQ